MIIRASAPAEGRTTKGDGMEDLEAVNLAADWADISQGLRKDLGHQLHSQWI
jgi:chromosomal replication initiator protein